MEPMVISTLQVDQYASFLCAAHESFASCPVKVKTQSWVRQGIRSALGRQSVVGKPWKAILKAALLQTQNPSGCVLEFGVFNGKTINYLAQERRRSSLHGFDSFKGFPEDGRSDWQLDLSVSNQPHVPENVTLHAGYFEDKIPAFVQLYEKQLEDICLVHIDCDIYSSTKTVFTHIGPYLKPGHLIVFDELMNYNEFASNEFLAFYEFLMAYNLDFEWAATVGQAYNFIGVQSIMPSIGFAEFRAQNCFQNQAIRLVERKNGRHFKGNPVAAGLTENLSKTLTA